MSDQEESVGYSASPWDIIGVSLPSFVRGPTAGGALARYSPPASMQGSSVPAGGMGAVPAQGPNAQQIAQAQAVLASVPQYYGQLPSYHPQGAPGPNVQVIQRPVGGMPGSGILRRQICPIGAVVVPAGGTVTVKLFPQRPFRIERMALVSSVVGSVTTLEQFSVGATPQFVSSGSVNVQCFAPTAFDVSLRGDTASPGVEITLVFANSGGVVDNISGMLLGEALD